MRGGARGGVILLTMIGLSAAWGIDVFPKPTPDASPYGLSTYLWVCGLALLGAAASYLQRMSERPALLSARRIAAEGLTAIAAGLCAFWSGESAAADLRLTAMAIVVAGYFGKQALERLKVKD